MFVYNSKHKNYLRLGELIMKEDKMHLVNKLFNNDTIRTVWDNDKEKYYISIVDMVGVLSGSDRPRKYWSDLKKKLIEEGNEVSERIRQLKLKAKVKTLAG